MLPTVEEISGKMPQLVTKLEDIPGSGMEMRALEVALVGGHSLAIFYNTGAYSPQLIQAGMRMAREVPVPFHGLANPWCPCGNYGSPKHECGCSARVIKAHLSRLGRRMDEFTIWLGASVPLAREIGRKGEPETAILERIRDARARPEPSDVLDASSRELVECYLKQGSVALDIARVKAVAASIARLDRQDRILVQHVAEALQYQPYSLHAFNTWSTPRTFEART